MNFKSFYGELTRLSSKSKERLIELYADYINKNSIRDEVFYESKLFKFTMNGVKMHFEELMNFIIYIPQINIYKDVFENSLPIEDYLLRHLYGPISAYSANQFNKNKEKRDQFIVYIQESSQIVTKRNGVFYDEKSKCFLIKLIVQIPLMSGGKRVDGKKAIKCFKELFKIIEQSILTIEIKEIQKRIELYNNQQQIRKFLLENDYVCFIGNGSILPRYKENNKKKENSIPFQSPKESEIIIHFENGDIISGMGLKKGITIIIGDGYSGKSTLLNAIESGIYDHCFADGREYVITNTTALMCNAEEGRSINKVDMSYFFKKLPGEYNLSSYCTYHASGSVSQSCNILEAIDLGSKLILIDEDKSAVNFMYRDELMKQLIPNSSIITLAERLIALKTITSFIIVVGSISDFMKYADTIILMKDFVPQLLKNDIKHSYEFIEIPKVNKKIINCEFRLFFKQDVIDNKILIYDDFLINIASLSSVLNKSQISFLQYAIKKCLEYAKEKTIALSELANIVNSCMLNKDCMLNTNMINENTSMFFESIRDIDIQLTMLRLKRKDTIEKNLFK